MFNYALREHFRCHVCAVTYANMRKITGPRARILEAGENLRNYITSLLERVCTLGWNTE